jgi:hypothetical protein
MHTRQFWSWDGLFWGGRVCQHPLKRNDIVWECRRVRVMKRVSFVIYVGKRKGMWVMMWHFIMHMQEDAIVQMPMGGTPKYSANNTNLTNTCPSIGPQEPSRPVPTGSSIPSSNLPSSLKKS